MKIKQVFVKDRDVDLPEGAETAPTNTITLPENYDDLELFFEPDAAAGLGHGAAGASASRSASAAANRADITLEDPDAFDDGFEEQYAYDDRIVGDDDDDFIDDEIDTELDPRPVSNPGSTAPRPFGEWIPTSASTCSWRITTRRTSGAGSVPRRVDRTTTISAASSTATMGTMISCLCRWTTIWRMRMAFAGRWWDSRPTAGVDPGRGGGEGERAQLGVHRRGGGGVGQDGAEGEPSRPRTGETRQAQERERDGRSSSIGRRC